MFVVVHFLSRTKLLFGRSLAHAGSGPNDGAARILGGKFLRSLIGLGLCGGHFASRSVRVWYTAVARVAAPQFAQKLKFVPVVFDTFKFQA